MYKTYNNSFKPVKARLAGLDRYLSSALSVPVAPFEPFTVVDVSKLAPEAASELESRELESVVALGLAYGASDPNAYGIEILPAPIQKRRDFLNGPAFLIAAAVLMLGFLGWRYSQESAQLEQLERSQQLPCTARLTFLQSFLPVNSFTQTLSPRGTLRKLRFKVRGLVRIF